MTLIFTSDDDATNWALEWLRQRGFAACRAEVCDWRLPRDLGHTYGLKSNTLSKRLAHPLCPHTPRECGPTGRLLRVAMSPELHAWLSRPAHPGARP